MARKLTVREAEGVAESARQIFNLPLALPEIFRATMPHRLVVESSAFTFSPEQFEALRRAALSVNDRTFWLALTGDYRRGHGEILPLAWEIPPGDYEGYAEAPYGDDDVGRELGIPLYRVLFSPTGQWGALLDDNFAVLGGSAKFIEEFKQGYPEYPEDLSSFVERKTRAGRDKGANTDWVRPLLAHIYGDLAPVFPSPAE